MHILAGNSGKSAKDTEEKTDTQQSKRQSNYRRPPGTVPPKETDYTQDRCQQTQECAAGSTYEQRCPGYREPALLNARERTDTDAEDQGRRGDPQGKTCLSKRVFLREQS